MMQIKQLPEGWTVVHTDGRIMLVNEQREPLFYPTYEDVRDQCYANNLYPAKEGNPDGYPAGALLELVIDGVPQ